jgi:hypothetical protein
LTGDAATSGTASFFDELSGRTADAEAAAGGAVDRWFEIAGGVVRLRFAGPAMVDFACRALSHLPCEAVAEPDLTVRLWDSGSTGVAIPPPPPQFERFRGNGAIEGDEETGIRAAFVASAEALSVFDPERRTAIHWVRDAATIREYDKPAPLRLLLNWWLETRGVTLVHGAAVGGGQGAALLAGSAGAGKSTTALACLAAGLDYIADDYCAVVAEPAPTVHSIYCTGKAVTANLSLLPGLVDLAPEPDSVFEEKSIYYLGEHVPERIARERPLRAVLVPQIAGGPATRLEPASPAVALTALAPSTLFQLAHAGGGAFARLGALVRAVPCYRLLVGDRPVAAATAIRELLAPR